ncbi:MAG: Rne/Rng family ribonuclease [bacterium]|nr:Rne/Rng family ribonuclease [bacterium]MDY2829948.1 Rne/Rng family ribonuclease [Alphaproteobacteria bacterium]
MTKRMLIDDTQPEETRVVVVNGNKLEDVEFESTTRKQIKGNIYLGKVMRVEPSLQACFVDYGGNRHGFMAFGEIHPDYYHVSEEELAEIDKEVDEIIENKKRLIKEREAERERRAKERALAREEALKAKAAKEAEEALKAQQEQNPQQESETAETPAAVEAEHIIVPQISEEEFIAEEEAKEEEESGKKKTKRRVLKKKYRKQIAVEEAPKTDEEVKVLAEDTGLEEMSVSEEIASESAAEEDEEPRRFGDAESDDEVDDDDEETLDFELQRKLIRARKLFHRHKIQDVIKEGQTVLVQVVKEERGNKGAALTTYLSLAGRYCVLMPNRIKSGGVSRKITNAADRNRLKEIVKELPLTSDMSIIVRTAGEEKSKSDIVRDYNYLIRAWNQIRIDSLKGKAPALIHEEGDLIKRALRDIYTKDISEILVAGDEAYKRARDFFKILSPHNLKKIKNYRGADMPLFQRFQVEGQLDKLHDPNAQLESGGYLVINPTEALVSIDVNSGRATKEKDLEETALKTNLEACDEIARQLRMRNLAGLVVIDFIDMDEPANNHAVEKRMKEALKKDRSRIQVGKMSMFGLLELSRQRMHSAFWESNYQVCPYCHGKGITRTLASAGVYILRALEEEGIKNRSSKLNIFVPSDVAVYLLNHKRKVLSDLEEKYKLDIVISADDSVKCISDYRIERTKAPVLPKEDKPEAKPLDKEVEAVAPVEEPVSEPEIEMPAEQPEQSEQNGRDFRGRRGRRGRFDRRRGRGNYDRRSSEATAPMPVKEKQEAVILYNSHEDIAPQPEQPAPEAQPEKKGKSTWWKKLIKG